MSAAMDNLLKMFKTARETAGESSGTAPSAADVEALPVHFAVLIAEDDDPRYHFLVGTNLPYAAAGFNGAGALPNHFGPTDAELVEGHSRFSGTPGLRESDGE
ncbi:hypothetical protein TIFTF001_029412 [Ficus carica]|uniref:Uncharacterized protein n=1 Tax=Ficus carica TaxID=3494 RepID=A0AA88DRP3_FICCA|nr:hypothetical protein TIFTF001_029412 [Ficus carica]